jgi:hypothetical protein
MMVQYPDFHITHDDKDAAFVIRKAMQSEWRNKYWKDEARKAIFKWQQIGSSFVFYRWDAETGAEFEHASSWDVACDKHISNWHKARWIARRIAMPLREGVEQYGAKSFNLDTNVDDDSLDRRTIYVWCYWDRATEAHVLSGEDGAPDKLIFRGANLYGRIPYLVLVGEPNPTRNPHPLGDHHLASGMQQAVSDIDSAILNMGKHDGTITLIDGSIKADTIKEGLEQGFVPYKGLNAASPPILRIPAVQPSAALLEARQQNQSGLDAVQGVSGADRGVFEQQPNSATEVAYLSERSGRRGDDSRVKVGDFLNEWAQVHIQMMVRFGGPSQEYPATTESVLLWELLQGVQEVRVIDGSTFYTDPSVQQQQAMQLYQMELQSMELWLNLSQLGLVSAVPNIKARRDDMLRAFGKHELDEEYVTPQVMAPPMPGATPPSSSQAEVPVGEEGPAFPPQLAAAQTRMMGGSSEA